MRALAVGETDLGRLLAGLAPALAAQPRAIRTQAHDAALPADALMVFREDEATTVILPLPGSGDDASPWAQITLRVHSSLHAVGMMAAVAAALAERGIPCNAVSAYHHDHLFVPWGMRERALDALHTLAQGETA